MGGELDYQAVIADLRARRVRLDNLIAEYEALIIGQGGGGAPEGTQATPAGTPIQGIHPDTFFGLGIAEASKKYLKLVGRAQHTRIIGDALARGGIKRPSDNSLFSILVRAAKGRDVVKVGKGMWGLAEWYPKRPVEPVEAKRKRRSGGRKRKAQKALPEPKAATEKLVVVKKRATERPAST